MASLVEAGKNTLVERSHTMIRTGTRRELRRRSGPAYSSPCSLSLAVNPSPRLLFAGAESQIDVADVLQQAR